jgi:hypothetical protein
MNTLRFAVVLVAGLLATGCAELAPFETAVDGASGDALQAARAPASEQKAALARAQQRFIADPSAGNRLRLATLLAALPVPLRDDARALELLEPIADAGSPGSGRFAAFLAFEIQDRQRLQREVDRLLKERNQERAQAERERTAAEKDRVERDKREEALKQQLEALRAIERGILEREDRLRKRQR